MSDSPTIPPELFYHIFENLPLSSLTSTARANTSLRHVSERLLYRSLVFSSVAQTVQCCQTLVQKPEAAATVQEVVVMISPREKPDHSTLKLLSSALRLLVNLKSLHMAMDGPFVPLLNGCTFAHLVTFSSIMDLSSDYMHLARFLDRHPTIVNLCLGGEKPGQMFALLPSSLPALRTYKGSRRLAAAVVPSRPVHDVTLAWRTENMEQEVDRILPCLAQSSSPICLLNCAVMEWSPFLIRAIARNLPKLHSIRLYNMGPVFTGEKEAVSSFTEVLPVLSELKRLEIAAHRDARSIFDTEVERKILSAWQSLCPTMNQVTFPSGRTWQRRPNGNWVNAQEQP